MKGIHVITQERRNSTTDRRPVDLEVEIRQRSIDHFRCRLADLSPTGFRLVYPVRLDSHLPLFIRIGSLSPLTAHIKWQQGDLYGCMFDRPLSSYVFEHIVNTAMAR